MNKRLCYVFICFLIICNLFNFNVLAKKREIKQWGDYTYVIQNDGVGILNYNGNDEQVVIPSEFDGIPVKCIGEYIENGLFVSVALIYGNDSVKSVIIPEGVEYIGCNAFSNAKALTEISIPNTVTYIGEQAFVNCKSLKEITIPESVTTIERDVFYRCDNLTKATILGTTVGESMFSNLESLTTVILGENIIQIEPKAYLKICK